MSTLVILQGPQAGQEFPLGKEPVLLGRETDVTIRLASKVVSRHHARIIHDNGAWFVEDLGSSNGTYVNGGQIKGRTPIRDNDQLQIGEFIFALKKPPQASAIDTAENIKESVNALLTNSNLFSQNPAHKLQVVLEIAQHLGQTLEIEPLLSKLLDYLLLLFPTADRGMVLLVEEVGLVVRATRSRRGEGDHPYSRTIVQRALDDGVGLISEDVGTDQRFQSSATIGKLDIRSVMCVPLIGQGSKRLGVIQFDRQQSSKPFKGEDLKLLATLAIQVSVVLENAALYELRLKEAKLRRELALAREIQQGFLPLNFAPVPGGQYEFYARVQPAMEVSGDLYDVFALHDGRLAFLIGDVSGKGMPASLFMMAVRTLARHLAWSGVSPAQTLNQLNMTLAADNPSGMFVTLSHGIYDPKDGRLIIASAGHPLPLLRRTNGKVEELALPSGSIVGYLEMDLGLEDTEMVLQVGETIILYTDGFTEAFAQDGRTMFGTDRLSHALGGERAELPLHICAMDVTRDVERFTGSADLQDDQTIVLLRRIIPLQEDYPSEPTVNYDPTKPKNR